MGPLPLVKVAGIYIKKEEMLMSWRLRMQLFFFRRAVAVGIVVGMSHGSAGCKPARRALELIYC